MHIAPHKGGKHANAKDMQMKRDAALLVRMSTKQT
jgi:hypothetical protein